MEKDYSEQMLDTVQKAVRKLEAYTNIAFYVSPIPEEFELKQHEVMALTGHFVGYSAFSEVSAVRFNFRIGIGKKQHVIHSCDVWLKETSLSTPSYTVVLNPNLKTEISSGLRTVADLLVGQTTMLEKETNSIKYMPTVLKEKIQNDIEEFIDEMGIDNLKTEPLSKIYNKYSMWADTGDRRIIPKPQFNRVFKDYLTKKKVASDTISTGHIYPGVKYYFISNPEEQKLFSDEIIKNKTYYKARMMEVLITRMAKGDPEINGILMCGQEGNDLSLIRNRLRASGAQSKTVYVKDVYGFAGFIQTLWNNRAGKILVFSNADSLFSGYNVVVKGLVHSLLEGGEGRIVRYNRSLLGNGKKKESLEFLISEANPVPQQQKKKSFQPKPNSVSKKNFDIDDILDSEDKAFGTEENGIPDVFEFKSKTIFLTGLASVPEDFKNIPFAIELNYTKEQALSLVEANLDKIMVNFTDFNFKRKREVLKFMRDNKKLARNFNYETFWNIATVYMSGIKNWKRWGLAQLIGSAS